MKFVALISGGKDSFFNIHHCISQGHELEALGNLYPAQTDRDEIDSFMFQTVGHDIIEYYSECVEVPLYRQEINGSSKNQLLEYSITEDDEIEDLYQLLKKVKESHPDIEGVSCGAILSHYQRTRVENVCGRLGMTCLAYLWQRSQLELMGEMCNSQLDARIIKVAAIGLNEKSLGKSIQQLFPLLIKLNQMYEVHICGEGGEFETIVLDAPFFKHKKLEIVDQQVIKLSSDDVSYLKIKVELRDKVVSDGFSLSAPGLLCDGFSSIYEDLVDDIDAGKIADPELRTTEIQPNTCVLSSLGRLYISNLTSAKASLSEQASDIFRKLQEILTSNNLTLDNVQHVTLLLSDISQFADINTVYEEQFSGFYLPPSRICIETTLHPSSFLQLSCIAIESLDKKGIHIRSRSYWAPQNIGPYSQARVEENPQYQMATLSGQIPLIPSTMELHRIENTNQRLFSSILSLQHLYRVKELINVPMIGKVICFLTESVDLDIVCKTWTKFTKEFEDGNDTQQLIIVKVKKLPKNAIIEWAGLSFKNITGMYEDESEIKPQAAEISEIVNLFEESSVVNINKGSLQMISLFTNNLETLNLLIDLNERLKGHLQIFTKIANTSLLRGNSELLPVLQSWTNNKIAFEFAIIWTVNN